MAQIDGTSGNDVINGTADNDNIRGFAGNDIINGGAGIDSIDGGSGDDLIHGGDGNDYITDGDGADQLYGDGGDDNISISLRGGGRLLADGGAGNDTIYAANGGGPNQSVTFIGGEGNDSIGLDGFAADNIIDAGIGDDVVRLGSTLGVTVTLGAGADTLELNGNFFPNPDAVIVTDYAPGVDRILPNFETLLSGWSGSMNPFGEGYVRLVQAGSDTLFQVDVNGGGDSYITKLRLQNTQAASFTAADFGGYPPDGSPPPGQTFIGTADNDILRGTVGADTISGLDGDDQIDAGAGNDTVNGGAGNDNISGGSGDDVIHGGIGDDHISDGQGADQLFGEDGNDSISISLRGGGRILADGGAGNDIIGASNGGGPNQSVTFIGGAGNDTISLYGFASDNIIDAGTGDDLVILGSTLGVTVSLGAGADIIRLEGNFFPNPDAVIITDYVPGIDKLLPQFEQTLSGWSGATNPFGDGFVRLVQSGADTLFQVDRNGGGDNYVTKLRFLNLQVEAFTAADFGGFPPDGSPPPGQTIVGTAGDDNLTGTVGADTISGLDGNDTINAGASNDVVYGGGGHDNIQGGAGDDIIYGGDGNDSITDGQGADQLFGEAGDDFISINLLGGGRTLADGGAGNDYISASNGGGPNQSVTLIGGDGNDTITLNGFARDNIIDAGNGDDIVALGSAPAVSVTLGAGVDTVRLLSNFGGTGGGAIITDFRPGVDKLDIPYANFLSGWNGSSDPFAGGFLKLTQNGADTILQFDGNGGGDAFTTLLRFENTARSQFSAADFNGYAPFAPPVTVIGTDAGEALMGGAGDDLLDGGGGDDTLDGGLGRDTILGGSGNDYLIGGIGDANEMYGGTGNDVFEVSVSGDSVIENAAEGTDQIRTTLGRFVLPTNVEQMIYTGTAAFNGVGNDADNFIVGAGGNDTLDGGLGSDTLLGGAGNDIMIGGTGAANEMIGSVGDDVYFVSVLGDSVVELVGEGTDQVRTDIARYVLNANVEQLVFTGASDFNGVGSDDANLIVGGAGNDILDGLGGNDVLVGGAGDDILIGGTGMNEMQGGAGNDTYFVSTTGDSVVEAAGGGTDRVITDAALYVLGNNVENLTYNGNATFRGEGNDLDNLIVGGRGNDVLLGHGGNDTILGGSGNDLIEGGAGDDSLSGGLGADTLTGGAGLDRFVFNTALGTGNIDHVTDFATGQDGFQLDHAVFAALGTGMLAQSQFVLGTAAQDADDRIIYDAATGTLYYDADGNGAGAAVAFATIGAGLTLVASDLVVI